MELEKIGVKFFVSNPESVAEVRRFIPVFHGWIQRQAVSGHLLIDVHDYSHIYQGPGILLVGHEGNFSIDLTEGRPGLLYQRKHGLSGTPEERCASILHAAWEGCKLLEVEGVRFNPGEMRIIGNDRLNTPNIETTFGELHPVIAGAIKRIFPGCDFTLFQMKTRSKERFVVSAQQKTS